MPDLWGFPEILIVLINHHILAYLSNYHLEIQKLTNYIQLIASEVNRQTSQGV